MITVVWARGRPDSRSVSSRAEGLAGRPKSFQQRGLQSTEPDRRRDVIPWMPACPSQAGVLTFAISARSWPMVEPGEEFT